VLALSRKIVCLGNFSNWSISLKVADKQEKTQSGIIVMTGMDDFVNAQVIVTGDGLFTQTGDRIPVTVKVGDRIVIHKNEVGKHKKITIDDEEFVLIRESEIALIEVK
jgi:chaperonin GroES